MAFNSKNENFLMAAGIFMLSLLIWLLVGNRREVADVINVGVAEAMHGGVKKIPEFYVPIDSAQETSAGHAEVMTTLEQSLLADVTRRQKTYNHWSGRSPEEILAEVQSQAQLFNPKINREFTLLVDALVSSLRRHGSERSRASVQNIGELINQPSTSGLLRGTLIDVLSRTATQATAAKLVELAMSDAKLEGRSPTEGLLRPRIAALGAEWRARGGQEDLTPILLAAVTEHDVPVDLRVAVMMALGDVGSSEAAEWLVSQLFKSNPTLQLLETTDDEIVDALLGGLRRLRTKEAVAVLAPYFEGYDFANPKLHVLGPVLAGTAQVDGTVVILNWAVDAPAEFSPAIFEWLCQLRTTGSVTQIRSYLRLQAFKSNDVRLAVEAALAKLSL